LALALDVTDEGQWRAAIEATVAAFGGLHGLINNAGIGLMKPLAETTLEEWRRIHAVDLDSVFIGCRDAMGPIEASGGGSIVNIASVAGVIAAPNLAAYNSAKAAVVHLTRSVALSGAERSPQVRCNAVLPAFIDTPILDPLVPSEDPAVRAKILGKLARQIPLGHVGEPDDVAYAVVYLVSDESKFMTGSALLLDGGISAQ
jgi:NAD(P)-dependent dehydrogenase (short-subunit alcohol dehydrogenase family)